MARYIGSACKICRREGAKLYLKGDRCLSDKCAFERRPVAPGQHGAARKKQREYGVQLREKQKVKRYYGLLEKQFNNYFQEADRLEGMTGENLLRICESRLDNVAYLLGWASSRAEARQLTTHGHYLVNGKKVDIPSYLLKAGDVVSIREKSRDSEKIKAVLEANASRPVPEWLDKNGDDLTAKIVKLPDREQIEVPVEEHLIVEFYSK